MSFKAIDAGPRAPAASRPARLRDTFTLKLHSLAVRLDLAPQDFGDAGPTDLTDARAVRREWLRQIRMWAAYNPEDVFALKAGVTASFMVFAAVVIAVAAI